MRPEIVLNATATQLNAWYAGGETTPSEVAEVVLTAARAADEAFNAVAVFDAERALAEAEESTLRWRTRSERGPLDGIPVSIKDSLKMDGVRSWFGSKLNASAPLATEDGPAVSALRNAGAILFATTTMPDLGLLAAGISSQFGIIRNPWNPELNPGGSSSGAGALLASGVGPLSLGSDQGGSIRLPAGLCGVVGFKPTQGMIAGDSPRLLGSAGPMARTVSDASTLMSVVSGPDVSDYLSLPGGFAWDARIPERLDGVQVGVITATGWEFDVDAEVVAAVETQVSLLVSLGAQVTRIDPIFGEDDHRVFADVVMTRGLPELLAAPPEMWNYLPKTLFEDLTSKQHMTAAEHVANERQLEQVRKRMAAMLNGFDYVVSPVTPVVSFPAEDPAPMLAGDERMNHLIFTSPYNITSLPAGTVPVAMSSTGMPIGVQVGGRRFDDAGVLGILALMERERGFELDYPIIQV